MEEPKNTEFCRRVKKKEGQKIAARGKGPGDIWFGVGTFGIVGWAVAIPTVIGVFLGAWIDTRSLGQYSWALMLLGVGIAVGCVNAWVWISRQRKSISCEGDGDET
ncbi:AtpZ/AtpI family protein [Thermodesulfobacteriota bacterium]